MATFLLGDIMLRFFQLVWMMLLLTNCHRDHCPMGGFQMTIMRGEAEPSVYRLGFTAHFDVPSVVGTLAHSVECRTEDARLYCTADGDPESENPRFWINSLMPEESERTWLLLIFRVQGCIDEICDPGPSIIEIRVEKEGELVTEMVVQPEYTQFCRNELGDYEAASLEIVLE